MAGASVTATEASTAAFDPADAAVMQCPFPHYARLRDVGGVTEVPGASVGRPGQRVFAVSRFDLVNEVLLDWRTYSSRFGTPSAAPPEHLRDQLQAIAAQGFHRPATMLTADPPDHTRYRRLVAQAFTPTRVADLAPAVGTICHELIEDFLPTRRAEGRIDLLSAFSAAIPTKTMATLLGIPQARYTDFKRWADASAATIGRRLDDAQWVESTTLVVELQQYFAAELEARRAHPADDFLSDLVRATLPADDAEGARTLSMQEMISIIQQLVVAGSETTASPIADAVVFLADRPDEWRRLATDAARAVPVVEEAIRCAGTNQGMFRIATTDTELNGVAVAAGSTVWVLFGSVNGDRAEFGPTADVFDPDRDGLSRHVGFGRGVHYCLGAPLARLETTIALSALAQRFSDVRVVDPSGLRYAPSCVLRGLERLDVTLAEATPGS
jgi:cytochrome P450